MGDSSRLELVIDSKGVVTANGNLDLFKKKSDEAAKAATGLEASNKKNAKSFDLVSEATNIQTLAMGAANLAIVSFMNSCAKTAGRMEMLQTNLRVVTGSAVEADRVFRELQQFAAETPFSVEGITDTAIQLMQVGVSAKDLQEQLRMLGDVSGGSQEKLNRIMMNYTQILSVGKASTMDIRQFAQANLPIYQELENVTGKTGEALQDMITNGEITGKVITEAFKRMTEEGGKFYNGMALAADTWEGKKSTMEDSISNLATKFGNLWLLDFQKNAFDAITAITGKAANWLDRIKFEKEANDNVFNNPNEASYAEWEFAANLQIKKWREQVQYWKQVGGDYYLESDNYQEALKNLNDWITKLDEVTKKEKERSATSRDEVAAIDNAAKKRREWQEILKQTLDLKEVTTGKKAVDDYQKSLEDSLEGAIVYAQLTGGNIAKVYTDYAKDVDEAVKTLLLSGQFSVDDNAIQGLLRLKKKLAGEASDRTGLTGYQFGQSQNPQFMLDDQKKQGSFNLAPLGDATGFNFKLSEDFGITDDTINEQEERAKRLQDIFRQLGEDLKKFAADSTFTALWDMGEALYAGEDAAKAFGKSLLRSILNNVPAMLFQAGFQLAITGNVYGGLALMAASGLAGVAGGYLTSMMDDNGERQSEADKLQIIANQLRDLITEARAESIYYQDMLQTKLAQYENSTISRQSVNDAIIAPGGKIITTAPDDYLYASKDPSKFGGGSTNVQVSVVNEAGDVAVASATQRRLADGTTEILVGIKRMIASDIASGDLDSAFEARETRLAGRRVGV